MNSKKTRLYVIAGPTASGKTAAAIGVAKLFNKEHGRKAAEIISADSIQIYKEMDIGSAKPTIAEMDGIPHHMLDIVKINDGSFNVSRYREKAVDIIHDIEQKDGIPIVVGGTGLYINSLIFPLNFSSAEPDSELRSELSSIEENNPGSLHEMLTRIDATTAKRLHPNDTKRIIRAIEVFEKTGETLSSLGGDFENKRRCEIEFEPVIAALNMDRAKLYERIEKRIDIMMEHGLLSEVKKIFDEGYDRNLPALQGLGYKQLIAYFMGECSLDEAIEIIKRDTRRFAKRQISWFKRDKRIQWFDPLEFVSSQQLSEEIFNYFITYKGESHVQ